MQRPLVLFVLLAPAAAQDFAAPADVGPFTLGGGNLELRDFDGDGTLDLLYLQRSVGDLRFFRGRGDGTFDAPLLAADNTAAQDDLAVLDANGDGVPDVALVTSSTTPSHVLLHLGNGDGSFQPAQSVGSALSGRRTIDAGDVDGDGIVDLVWATGSGTHGFCRGLGNGAFANAVIGANGAAGTALGMLADVDGDGTLDHLLVGGTPRAVGWQRGSSTGTFGARTVVPSAALDATDVQFVDVDADGVSDLVVTSAQGDRVEWLRGLGGGTFGTAQALDVGADGPERSIVVDTDRDGTLDVLTLARLTGELRLVRGLGAGNFAAPEVLSTGFPGGRWLAAGDLDGDCDHDLVATSALRVFRLDNVTALGNVECTSTNNSTGSPSLLVASGSARAVENCVVLTASDLPQNVFGFFLNARQAGHVPNPGGSDGTLCLGGAIGRYVQPGQLLSSGASGTFRLRLDLGSTPTPTATVAILAGETWRFQGWHRDSNNGTQTSNFTQSVAIAFD